MLSFRIYMPVKQGILVFTWTLIFAFLAAMPLYPQQFNFRTFTTKDGLANNNVREIALDSSGFLWVATWDGLSRYDGYEFKNYYHVPGDSSSLPYFAIKDLAVDGGNNLWIMSDMGQVVQYDRSDDNFRRVEMVNFPQHRTDASLDVDNKGNLWIISEFSLYKRDFRTGRFERFDIFMEESNFFSAGGISCVMVTNDREIWLAGDDLYHLTRRTTNEGDKVYIIDNEYRIFNSKDGITRDYMERHWSELYISPGGNKWFLSNFGLFRLEKDNQFWEFKDPIPPRELVGNRVFAWASRKEGLSIYNPGTRRTEYIRNEALPFTLAFLQVDKNQLWFSARSGSGNSLGLVQVMVSPLIFRNYQSESGIDPSEAVYSVYKDHSGVIWAGIRGRESIHIIRPDGSTGKIDPIYPDKRENVAHLRAIVETRTGLWLGYYLKRLEFYDFASRKFTIYHPEVPPLFHTILPEANGTILVATNNIYRFDPVTGHSTLVWNREDGDFTIYRLIRDKSGTIWAGSRNNTIIAINPANWSSRMVKLGLDGYNVEDICEGDDNNLWAATLGGGVCNYKPGTGEMKFYTTANGLSNNTTYSIRKDSGGFVWVTTNNGISRIDPRTGLVKVYNISDGLNIVEFNSDASFAAPDGEFMFGGIGGIAAFYPDSLQVRSSSSRQRVIITDISVSGVTKHYKNGANDSDTITLKAGENNFRITFSSIDFINSGKTKYRYLLQGINRDWAVTDFRDRSVNFANLRPGWYDFRIQATDRNGNWCNPKLLKIRATPYFYQTRLFSFAFPCLIIGLIGLAIYLYIRNLRQQQSLKLDTLRLQTLRGQMNPHFVFNSLNSINYFLSNNDKISGNRYIADFSKLIRSILNNMNHDFITLDREIEMVTDFLKVEYLRFGDRFDYEIFIDPAIEPEKYRVSPGHIQPFIENSIWHGMRGLSGRKGTISLSFTLTDHRIKCTVEDDGIGRKKAGAQRSSQYGTESHGISIVLERLKIINKLLKTDYQVTISDCYPDREDTGTRVVIDLPVIPG